MTKKTEKMLSDLEKATDQANKDTNGEYELYIKAAHDFAIETIYGVDNQAALAEQPEIVQSATRKLLNDCGYTKKVASQQNPAAKAAMAAPQNTIGG